MHPRRWRYRCLCVVHAGFLRPIGVGLTLRSERNMRAQSERILRCCAAGSKTQKDRQKLANASARVVFVVGGACDAPKPMRSPQEQLATQTSAGVRNERRDKVKASQRVQELRQAMG